jgi:hypothetical protein
MEKVKAMSEMKADAHTTIMKANESIAKLALDKQEMDRKFALEYQAMREEFRLEQARLEMERQKDRQEMEIKVQEAENRAKEHAAAHPKKVKVKRTSEGYEVG